MLAQDQNDNRKYGDLIEQYRSRIGSHDNFVKTKDILSRFKDHFWSVVLTMFHLNVFYLPILLKLFATGWGLVWGPGSCQLPIVLGGAVF